MFNMGLENEVQTLIKQGHGKDAPGMKAIGYSEFFQYSTKLYCIKPPPFIDQKCRLYRRDGHHLGPHFLFPSALIFPQQP